MGQVQQFFVQWVRGKSSRIRIPNKFFVDTLLENTFYKFNQTATLLHETVVPRQLTTISCLNVNEVLF